MLNERVVIPKILQPEVLRKLHFGHPGSNSLKALARQSVFWNDINKDIEDFVKLCDPCQMNSKLPAKADPVPWPTPTRPFERVHMDFAGPINGDYFLIIIPNKHSKEEGSIPESSL